MKRVYIIGMTPELSSRAEAEKLIESADFCVVNAVSPGETLPVGFRVQAGHLGEFEVVGHDADGRIALVEQV